MDLKSRIQALNRIMFEQEDQDVDPLGEESNDEEDFVLSEIEIKSEKHEFDDDDNYDPANNAISEEKVERRQSSTKDPESRGRRSITMHLLECRQEAREVKTPFEAWSLLFPNELLEIIVKHTNEEINRKLVNSNQSYYCETNLTEMKALIGLLYFAGLQGDRHKDTKIMWKETDSAMYRAVMTRNRFIFLGSCIRFDDKTTRKDRRTTDRLTAIREIWNMLIENCSKYYNSSQNCTIDEQFLGFRGKFFAKVCNKSKPERYGIKILCLNDSKTYYMLNAILYTGKVYTERLESVPMYYMRELSTPIHGSERNIICDNWFFSTEVIDTMKREFSLTLVNTIRKNKRQSSMNFRRFSTSRKTMRWTMRFFFGMLDQGVVNSNILYNIAEENKLMSRYDFMESLIMSLTTPHMQNRLQQQTLRKTLRMSICAILQIKEITKPREKHDKLTKRKRCYYCENRADRKTYFCCAICGKPVCDDHRTQICLDCEP